MWTPLLLSLCAAGGIALMTMSRSMTLSLSHSSSASSSAPSSSFNSSEIAAKNNTGKSKAD